MPLSLSLPWQADVAEAPSRTLVWKAVLRGQCPEPQTHTELPTLTLGRELVGGVQPGISTG